MLRAGRLGEYEFVRPGPAFSCIDTAVQTAEWRKSDEDVITGKGSIRKHISWQRNCDWKVKGRKDSFDEVKEQIKSQLKQQKQGVCRRWRRHPHTGI